MIELDKIYNEDCLEGMKRISGGAVDCIITDLPYGVLNEQSEGGSWDSIIPLEPMWEQFKRVTKPNAAIVLFCQGMFTAKLMMSQPKMWRYNLVWDKVRPTGFLNCNRSRCDSMKTLPCSIRNCRRITPKWSRDSAITLADFTTTQIVVMVNTQWVASLSERSRRSANHRSMMTNIR